MPTRRRAKGKGPADDLSLGTDKLYFKIGEVAEILGVAPHVLRFWESEFPRLRPQKSRTQHRVYRRQDVATLLRIKHLLYVERFTIAGARKKLRQGAAKCPMAAPSHAFVAAQSLGRVRSVLDELDALVASRRGLDPAAADPADYLRSLAEAEPDEPSVAPSRGLVDRPPRQPGSRP